MEVNDVIKMFCLELRKQRRQPVFHQMNLINIRIRDKELMVFLLGEIMNFREWQLRLQAPNDGSCEDDVTNRTETDNKYFVHCFVCVSDAKIENMRGLIRRLIILCTDESFSFLIPTFAP